MKYMLTFPRLHGTGRGPRYGEALRDNGRLQIQDPVFSERLWRASSLREVFEGVQVEGQAAVGLNPNIRLYRYTLA